MCKVKTKGSFKIERNTLNQNLRKQVLERDNYQCQKCGNTDIDYLEIHHIIPFSVSQSDFPENLVVLCGCCHSFAPNTAEKFQEFIKIKENLLEKAKTLVNQNKLEEAWEILKIVKSNEKERVVNGVSAKKTKVAAGLDEWKGRGKDRQKRKTDGYKKEQERRRQLKINKTNI